MKLKLTLAGAATAIMFAMAPAPASAAPAGIGGALASKKLLSSGSAVEKVGWKRRRHCHWRHGHRHCKWRRVWVPGLSIHIGPKYRHRHHR